MNVPLPVLAVENLSLAIATEHGAGTLIEAADLSIAQGEIHGLVGESGCGKSTLAKTILGILPGNARVTTGRVCLDGRDLLQLDERAMGRLRGGSIGFIPQDPFLSFNPLFPVGTQLLEILRWHAPTDLGRARAKHRARLIKILQAVQIADPEQALRRYPHQFSGGQRQRLMIAGALLCKPRLIIADEPTSALDVTTQRQILRVLQQMAREFDVAVLLITHDFGVAAETCDRVTVMYAGQTIETGPVRAIIDTPLHPYTRLLIVRHPERDGTAGGIPGTVPAALAMPDGCRFHPRCPLAEPRCSTAIPIARTADGRRLRCVLDEPGAYAEAGIAR